MFLFILFNLIIYFNFNFILGIFFLLLYFFLKYSTIFFIYFYYFYHKKGEINHEY